MLTPISIPQKEGSKVDLLDVSKLSLPRTSQQRMNDAVNQPPILKLFGDIWLSGELHLHFADTGMGKSILATTIGDALSKGKKVLFLDNECKPLTVLYYDFELSDRQFLNRYSSEMSGSYEFSLSFYVDTLDFAELYKISGEKSFEKALFKKFRYDIEKLKPDVLIIDNITYLKTQTTQTTDSALEVMRELTDLKREYNLSILVLAHTPKIDFSSPLTINSLAGSKHLSNFADSVSAIGKSTQGKDIRYIKQVKPSRSAELMYDGSNVIACQLVKQDNFLTFEFMSFEEEYNHLKQNNSKDEHLELIIEARKQIEQGKSYSEVAQNLLGDPKKKGTIYKWVNGKEVSTVSTVSNPENGNARNDGNAEPLPF